MHPRSTENHLRRLARRYQLTLHKSRTRSGPEVGKFVLKRDGQVIVNAGPLRYGLTLESVSRLLNDPDAIASALREGR